MYSIYLVEDDINLNKVITTYLQQEGWQVKSFITGQEALAVIDHRPHLWILDIMLPDIDGYHLISKIKEVYPHLPVIFISARDADLDKIVGLEKGSDDYLAKPFLPRELVIRTKKLLERVYRDKSNEKRIINYNKYKIDLGKRIVTDTQDKSVDLTSREFDLLLYFLNNIQQALSREQILIAIWGNNYFGTDRVVDDLIRRLRKKLPELKIETIYGYGYRLVKQ